MHPHCQMLIIIFCLLPRWVEMAGGRGGAIATKGGTGLRGPHRADPNDDSGSLSVILVVILPVLQMFLCVVIIVLLRMCYQNYCLKPKHKVHGSYSLKKHVTDAMLDVALDESVVAIAMTTQSSATEHLPDVVEIIEDTLEPIPGSSGTGSSGSTAAAATAVPHPRSSSVSPIEVLAAATRSSLAPPFRSLGPQYTLTSCHLSSGPHSLPISGPTASTTPLSHLVRAQLARSNLLNAATEDDSLNSETIDSEATELELGRMPAELPIDIVEIQQQAPPPRRSSSGNGSGGHQGECIYHPRHSNHSSRPTSAGSGTFKCMPTF